MFSVAASFQIQQKKGAFATKMEINALYQPLVTDGSSMH